ncbi:MAG TPA: glycosyltransferase family 39 protein, partial [Anaerolineae bacterium]|nr:glycosyltransferase family 39 protein [Anaerolineae bacterium]
HRIESAPPGLNGDELFNAIDALQLGPGRWQVFFEGNNGREALFLYLMAVPLRLLGQSVWAIRLPAVLLGTGVVLLTYGIGTLAFNRRIGFVAGLLIAVSLWPVMQARWGLRAVSLTFFTALTIYLYLLAMRRTGRALGPWIAAGLALGLSLYTYIPSRAFPLVILAWFAWIALTRRPLFGRIWRRLLLSLLLALIVFAPFGIYMVRFPEKVNQRIDSLQGFNKLEKTLEGDPGPLLRNVASVPLMFTFQGDTAARYHFDSRPVFDPLTGIFFYLGLVVTVWLAFRRGREPDNRSSYGLMLLWAAAMLAPNLIVGVNTSFLRAAGAIVPIYLIAAIGLDNVYGWFRRRWPQHDVAWRFAFAGLIAVGGLLTLIRTWHDYFNLWVNENEVRLVYHAGLAQIGDYLAQNQPPAGAQLFIAYDYVAETTPGEFRYYHNKAVTWFDHTNTFGWRPDQGQSWYFISNEKPGGEGALSRLQGISQGETVFHDNGDEAFTLYRVDPAGVSWRPEHETAVEFVNGPELIGFDMPKTLNRGQQTPTVLHWLIPEDRDDLPNRLSYAQIFLEDESGNVWQQAETLLGYPEAGWLAGDRFVTFLDLEIPAGMPPGPVFLRFGLRDWQVGPYTRVAVGSQTATRSGPFLVRGQLAGDVAPGPDTVVFDEQIALVDYRLSSQIAPGLPTDIALDWLALEKPADDYRVQLQLTDGPEGDVFYVETSTIWPGTYPPTSWRASELVTSFHRLHVPLEIPAVENPWLRLQLIPSNGDMPLPLSQGTNALTELMVDRREHLFEMPDIGRLVEARFGEQILLLGYDLGQLPVRPGDALDVTLYWQAIKTPSDGYTVLNHLVGDDGLIHGQSDGPPSGDAWFTASWLPGEIIVDRRTIPVDADAPVGPHTLYVGLYTGGDGQRLPAYLDGQPQADDRLPLTTIDVR